MKIALCSAYFLIKHERYAIQRDEPTDATKRGWPLEMPAFLVSAGRNPAIDFFIFTDLEPPSVYPSNVKFFEATFEELVTRVNQEIGSSWDHRNIKKIGDLKPFYGFLFEEELRCYEYVGNMDLDVVWGDITHFLNEVSYQKFDVIGSRTPTFTADGKPVGFTKKGYPRTSLCGHFTIYRNKERIYNALSRMPGIIEKLNEPGYASLDERVLTRYLLRRRPEIKTKMEKFGAEPQLNAELRVDCGEEQDQEDAEGGRDW